jgi:hypothetical protein
MDVYRDGSGLAFADGAAGPVGKTMIAAAGYMGTPLWGVLLLWVGQDPRGARRALGIVAVLLGVTAGLFIANPFGQAAIGVTALVVCAAALFLPARWVVLLCNFIAAQACIGAVVDIRVLYRPFLVVDGEERGSDAHQMAEATFGTDARWAIWFWASVWLLWALAILFGALVLARRRAAQLSGARDRSREAPADPATAAPRDGSDRGARRRSPETAPTGTDPSGPADTAGS